MVSCYGSPRKLTQVSIAISLRALKTAAPHTSQPFQSMWWFSPPPYSACDLKLCLMRDIHSYLLSLLTVGTKDADAVKGKDHILEMQVLWPKDFREDIFGRGAILCYVNSITFWIVNLTWSKMNYYSNISVYVGQDMICCYPQQVTVTIFERVIRRQDLWAAGLMVYVISNDEILALCKY